MAGLAVAVPPSHRHFAPPNVSAITQILTTQQQFPTAGSNPGRPHPCSLFSRWKWHETEPNRDESARTGASRHCKVRPSHWYHWAFVAHVRICLIHITDNGIGFKQEYADRIFGIFERLHGRTLCAGNGVGLSICRKIAERHAKQEKAA